MTADRTTPPIQRGFSAFLAEPVGLEKNGMQLSLLSALTRLGLDPWEEAARLAHMSPQAAARALETIIRRLPAGEWTASDTARMAVRLIERLPRPGIGTASVDSNPENTWRRLMWPAAVGGVVLAVLWMFFLR